MATDMVLISSDEDQSGGNRSGVKFGSSTVRNYNHATDLKDEADPNLADLVLVFSKVLDDKGIEMLTKVYLQANKQFKESKVFHAFVQYTSSKAAVAGKDEVVAMLSSVCQSLCTGNVCTSIPQREDAATAVATKQADVSMHHGKGVITEFVTTNLQNQLEPTENIRSEEVTPFATGRLLQEPKPRQKSPLLKVDLPSIHPQAEKAPSVAIKMAQPQDGSPSIAASKSLLQGKVTLDEGTDLCKTSALVHGICSPKNPKASNKPMLEVESSAPANLICSNLNVMVPSAPDEGSLYKIANDTKKSWRSLKSKQGSDRVAMAMSSPESISATKIVNQKEQPGKIRGFKSFVPGTSLIFPRKPVLPTFLKMPSHEGGNATVSKPYDANAGRRKRKSSVSLVTGQDTLRPEYPCVGDADSFDSPSANSRLAPSKPSNLSHKQPTSPLKSTIQTDLDESSKDVVHKLPSKSSAPKASSKVAVAQHDVFPAAGGTAGLVAPSSRDDQFAKKPKYVKTQQIGPCSEESFGSGSTALTKFEGGFEAGGSSPSRVANKRVIRKDSDADCCIVSIKYNKVPSGDALPTSQRETSSDVGSLSLSRSSVSKSRQLARHPEQARLGQLRKLEYKLKSMEARISQLAASENALDDLDSENSSYIAESKLKEAWLRTWKRYCKLLGEDPNDFMSSKGTKIKLSCSPFPELNRAVEKYVNRTGAFPNLFEVKQVCIQANIKHELGLKNNHLHDLAVQLFSDVGRKLKANRQKEFRWVAGSRLTDGLDEDPALDDEDLQMKLKRNSKLGSQNMNRILKEFVRKQYEQQELGQDDHSAGSASDAECNYLDGQVTDEDANGSENGTRRAKKRRTLKLEKVRTSETKDVSGSLPPFSNATASSTSVSDTVLADRVVVGAPSLSAPSLALAASATESAVGPQLSAQGRTSRLVAGSDCSSVEKPCDPPAFVQHVHRTSSPYVPKVDLTQENVAGAGGERVSVNGGTCLDGSKSPDLHKHGHKLILGGDTNAIRIGPPLSRPSPITSGLNVTIPSVHGSLAKSSNSSAYVSPLTVFRKKAKSGADKVVRSPPHPLSSASGPSVRKSPVVISDDED